MYYLASSSSTIPATSDRKRAGELAQACRESALEIEERLVEGAEPCAQDFAGLAMLPGHSELGVRLALMNELLE